MVKLSGSIGIYDGPEVLRLLLYTASRDLHLTATRSNNDRGGLKRPRPAATRNRTFRFSQVNIRADPAVPGNTLRAARFIVAFLRRALRPAEKFFVARVKEHDVFTRIQQSRRRAAFVRTETDIGLTAVREGGKEKESVHDQNPPYKSRIIIFVGQRAGDERLANYRTFMIRRSSLATLSMSQV